MSGLTSKPLVKAETLSALREMADLTAVKGDLLLQLLDEIDRLTKRESELGAEVRQLSRHIDRMANRPSSKKELALAAQIGDLMKGAEKITARNAELEQLLDDARTVMERQIARRNELVKALESAQRDAARYAFLREEGIIAGDAPVCYVYKDEADKYVDDLIREELKFKRNKT